MVVDLYGRQTRSIEACLALGEKSLVVKAVRFVNLAAVKLSGYGFGPARLWIRVAASFLTHSSRRRSNVTTNVVDKSLIP